MISSLVLLKELPLATGSRKKNGGFLLVDKVGLEGVPKFLNRGKALLKGLSL
jgi:hypothetical protein